MNPAAQAMPRVQWRGCAAEPGERAVAVEAPVALTYNRATHAVMLASPADLEDFAVGFSLSEGIIGTVADILALEIVRVPAGIECRMDLSAPRLDALTRRQRHIAGPSGCGLCGLDSLAEAVRALPPVPDGPTLSAREVYQAMQSLQQVQALNAATRAVHAAAFWTRHDGLVAVREDVGRHNALDKLAGAIARAGHDPAQGVVLLSSRVSVEMVQKTATLGAPIIIAVSAPTSLAIQQADAARLTLVGIARQDGFEVFTHPDRISCSAVSHVA